jgi:hypothetical protein
MATLRRFALLTPMVSAIIIAAGVTAALAYFVLPSSNNRPPPEPHGTTIPAPTAANAVDSSPTPRLTSGLRPTSTPAPVGVRESWEIAAVQETDAGEPAERLADESTEEPTPTPRVVRRPPPASRRPRPSQRRPSMRRRPASRW